MHPKPSQLPGEIKNRPPTGLDNDRKLAQATGKTEDGKRVRRTETDDTQDEPV
jgi:hypothetical protein